LPFQVGAQSGLGGTRQRILGGVEVPAAHQVGHRPGGGGAEVVVEREAAEHIVEVRGPGRVAVAEHGQRLRRDGRGGGRTGVQEVRDGDRGGGGDVRQHPAVDAASARGGRAAEPQHDPAVGHRREGRGAGVVLHAVAERVGQRPVQVGPGRAAADKRLERVGGELLTLPGGTGPDRIGTVTSGTGSGLPAGPRSGTWARLPSVSTPSCTPWCGSSSQTIAGAPSKSASSTAGASRSSRSSGTTVSGCAFSHSSGSALRGTATVVNARTDNPGQS